MIKRISNGLFQSALRTYRHSILVSSNLKFQMQFKPKFGFSQSSELVKYDKKSLLHWHWIELQINRDAKKSIQELLTQINKQISSKIYSDTQIQCKIGLTGLISKADYILLQSINKKFKIHCQQYQKIVLSNSQKNFVNRFLNSYLEIMVKKIKDQSRIYYQKFQNQSEKYRQISLWETRRIVQRQYLWALCHNFKAQEVYKNLGKYLVAYYLYQYAPYSRNIVNTIGKNANDFKLKNSDVGLTLRQIVLMELNSVMLQMNQLACIENTAKQQTIFVNKFYFYQTFKALFDHTETPFWEYSLQIQQSRFEQTNVNKNQFKICFYPTSYSADIFNSIFNSLFFDDYRKNKNEVDYFIGQKFNGKSHAIILARHLSSFLGQKMLTISDFQGKEEIDKFVIYLCKIITRDLWQHLDQKQIQVINKIMMSQNQQKLNTSNNNKLKRHSFIKNNPLVEQVNKYRKKLYGSKSEDCLLSNQALKQYMHVNINDYAEEYNNFLQILQILKKIDLNNLIIDQFNYFGRNLFLLIKSQNSQRFGYLARTANMCFSTTLLYQQLKMKNDLTKLKLFASTNDFDADSLLYVAFNQNFSYQKKLLGVRSYLFAGKEATDILYFYFQQILKEKYQKEEDNYLKSTYINFLNNKQWLAQNVVKNIQFGVSMRQCQNLSQKISNKLSQIYKKLLSSNSNIQQNINTPSKVKLQIVESQLLQNAIIPSIYQLLTQISLKINERICKFVQQNYKDNVDQAFEMISHLFCSNQNKTLQFQGQKVTDMFTHSKKLYYSFFKVEVPLTKTLKTSIQTPQQMHKGFQNYFQDATNFIQICRKIFKENILKQNKSQTKFFFKMQINLINKYKHQKTLMICSTLITSTQRYFGSIFQQYIYSSLLQFRQGELANGIKRMLELKLQYYTSQKYNLQMKTIFDKVELQEDYYKTDYIKKVQKIIKYFQIINNRSALYVLKKKNTNKGSDFQFWFKNQDSCLINIMAEVKSGQNNNDNKEIFGPQLFLHYIGADKKTVKQDQQDKASFNKQWKAKPINKKPQTSLEKSQKYLNYLKQNKIQFFFGIIHCQNDHNKVNFNSKDIKSKEQLQAYMKYYGEDNCDKNNSNDVKKQEKVKNILNLNLFTVFSNFGSNQIILNFLQQLNQASLEVNKNIKDLQSKHKTSNATKNQ